MKKDELKTMILEFILLIFLFFALFVSNIYMNLILALFLGVYAIIVGKLLKKRNMLSIYEKQVIFLMFGFAIIYLVVFYLMGLYFGFYKSVVQFGYVGLVYYIIPLSIIIFSSEIIRNVFLSQKGKLSKISAFVSMVLVDLIIYTRIYDLTNLNDFLTVVGFVLFASISCNLLYNYVCSRFGYKGIVVYRLIAALYSYFIPIVPNVYIFFRSFFRILYPYLIYLVLESTYSKSNFAVAYKDKRKSVIATTVLIGVMLGIIMLVSCKFRYGILVIGSDSMTGAINKGDAVIFEQYENQDIYEGEVIIFEREGVRVVHRVVDVKSVNNEYRYFTKGDMNENLDKGYVLKNDIVGVTRLRVKYIGYPTIWVRDIFSN